MQKKSLPLGDFYEGLYYEYEYDKLLWGDGEVGINGYYQIGIPFRYKQQEASRQGVGFVGFENEVYQPLTRNKQNARKFRFVIYDEIDFKPNDKIIRVRDNKEYMVRRTVQDETVTNSLVVLQFQTAKYHQPTVIEVTGS